MDSSMPLCPRARACPADGATTAQSCSSPCIVYFRWGFAAKWHDKDVRGMTQMMDKWGDSICHDALHALVVNAMTMDIDEQVPQALPSSSLSR